MSKKIRTPLYQLRKFREERELTQEEMAEKIGIRREKYAKIELGYTDPDTDFIRRFQLVFNLSAEDLVRIIICPERNEQVVGQ